MLAIHPGEILREEYMAPLGLSANALLTVYDPFATRIHEILHEKARRQHGYRHASGPAAFDRHGDVDRPGSMKPAFWKGEKGQEFMRIIPHRAVQASLQ